MYTYINAKNFENIQYTTLAQSRDVFSNQVVTSTYNVSKIMWQLTKITV